MLKSLSEFIKESKLNIDKVELAKVVEFLYKHKNELDEETLEDLEKLLLKKLDKSFARAILNVQNPTISKAALTKDIMQGLVDAYDKEGTEPNGALTFAQIVLAIFFSKFSKNEAFKGKDITDYVRQIWMLADLADKKAVALAMLDELDFKGKNAQYKTQIEKITSANKLDMFVSNLSLKGEELGVMR